MSKFTGARERELTTEFLRLKSQFLFVSHFCLVRRANEKGHVENLVGYARRNFLVPVPQVAGITELNERLENQCREELSRTVRGKDQPKQILLDEERAQMLPLPREGFDPARVATVSANSLSLVSFDRNEYSVPTECAHRELTVSAGIDEVRVLCGGQIVARHERCWERDKTFFNPVHYLAILERKPGALDFAKPLADWALPACFSTLRKRLETEFGRDGTRRYIRVLRLLEKSTLAELTAALERALEMNIHDAEAVRLILEQRRETPVDLFCLDGRPHLKSVRVDAPDLGAYGALCGTSANCEVPA